MPHLDDATALGFAAGALRGEAFAAALAHIDACAPCRLLVASAAGGRGADALPAMIGRFAIDGVAGRGAMGVVYRARDPRLERAVAIKALRRDAFAGEARARFEREARALARIDHPNVVRIYEVGEHDGELFLAMELVAGQTVQAWLAATPRRAGDIVAVFVQAARGLLAAHQAGLVHRDFKPANAMIDGDGRVRVTDFGLVHVGDGGPAAAVADGADAVTDLTRTGALVGTPAYLAPELFAAPDRGDRGDRGDRATGDGPEPRSDQFSLCVALYEALAGHRPFAADDVAGLRAAIDRGPAPPRRPIPRRVHRALRRGLAVAPADRFPSMLELIDAIAPPTRARRLAVATLATVGLTGVAAAAWVARARPPTPSVAAVAPGPGCPAATARWATLWTDERAAALRAAQIAGWPATPPPDTKPLLASRWAGLGRARATLTLDGVSRFGEEWRAQYQDVCVADTWALAARRRCLDEAADRLEALVVAAPGRGFVDELVDLGDDLQRCGAHLVSGLDVPAATARAAATEARAELARAAALRARGELDTAAAAIERAIAVGTATSSPSLLAEAWLERGRVARDAGDVPGSIDAWHAAIGHAQEVSHYRVLRHAADALAAQYALGADDRPEAERWLRTAAALDGKVPPSDSERAGRLLVTAHLARAGGDVATARRLLTEARALAGAAPGSDLAARIGAALAATSP